MHRGPTGQDLQCLVLQGLVLRAPEGDWPTGMERAGMPAMLAEMVKRISSPVCVRSLSPSVSAAGLRWAPATTQSSVNTAELQPGCAVNGTQERAG